jgi:hypothetical protein
VTVDVQSLDTEERYLAHDALEPFDGTRIDVPLTDGNVWRAAGGDRGGE